MSDTIIFRQTVDGNLYARADAATLTGVLRRASRLARTSLDASRVHAWVWETLEARFSAAMDRARDVCLAYDDAMVAATGERPTEPEDVDFLQVLCIVLDKQ